mmetsp:Transcript_22197/g.66717  ORF Transcript_22197/g.66717 Transcript_22197/m.66717 type:complete len:98 (-) Transcript_22197:1582-1875(-)
MSMDCAHRIANSLATTIARLCQDTGAPVQDATRNALQRPDAMAVQTPIAQRAEFFGFSPAGDARQSAPMAPTRTVRLADLVIQLAVGHVLGRCWKIA